MWLFHWLIPTVSGLYASRNIQRAGVSKYRGRKEEEEASRGREIRPPSLVGARQEIR